MKNAKKLIVKWVLGLTLVAGCGSAHDVQLEKTPEKLGKGSPTGGPVTGQKPVPPVTPSPQPDPLPEIMGDRVFCSGQGTSGSLLSVSTLAGPLDFAKGIGLKLTTQNPGEIDLSKTDVFEIAGAEPLRVLSPGREYQVLFEGLYNHSEKRSIFVARVSLGARAGSAQAVRSVVPLDDRAVQLARARGISPRQFSVSQSKHFVILPGPARYEIYATESLPFTLPDNLQITLPATLAAKAKFGDKFGANFGGKFVRKFTVEIDPMTNFQPEYDDNLGVLTFLSLNRQDGALFPRVFVVNGNISSDGGNDGHKVSFGNGLGAVTEVTGILAGQKAPTAAVAISRGSFAILQDGHISVRSVGKEMSATITPESHYSFVPQLVRLILADGSIAVAVPAERKVQANYAGEIRIYRVLDAGGNAVEPSLASAIALPNEVIKYLTSQLQSGQETSAVVKGLSAASEGHELNLSLPVLWGDMAFYSSQGVFKRLGQMPCAFPRSIAEKASALGEHHE